MLTCFLKTSNQTAIPIYALTKKQLPDWLSIRSEKIQQWVDSVKFTAKSGNFCLVPNEMGRLECVLLGVEDENDFWSFGVLPQQLPTNVYHLASSEFATKGHCFRACLAWGLGAYQFTRYQEAKPIASLLLPNGCDVDYLMHWVKSIYLGRDWVNTPADVMNPEYLAETVSAVAKECSAKFSVTVGAKLLKKNYPAIYAVGKGSLLEPRITEVNWGNPQAPLVTLIGKGVCFDTGGLDLKPPNGMRLMKKDMSGAAHALTLARMIMKENLPVRLRLLIPIVENSISDRSYRPGDVIKTRAGLHVEIDNTDAEGRLILCDALAAAVEEQPELIIDFASLTGAARVALGSDIPAFYSNHDEIAQQIWAVSRQQHDPIWLMPLYQPYNKYLKSTIADCSNCSTSGYGGSITAALYLQKFVPNHIPWVHFDFTAWNFETRPGRPEGAEILALRAVFEYLKGRFCS